jgi:hypothetical protein
MSINNITMKVFVISSHPYAFDAMFALSDTISRQWTGAGRVVFHHSGGGINMAWALVEADDEGYIRLKESGFDVQSANKRRSLNPSGESFIVEEDAGLVC